MDNLKDNFPLIKNNPTLAYLDSASSSQKPQVVIDAVQNYYTNTNANTGRGAYSLSIKSTLLVNDARKTVQKFINSKLSEEIIFTKGSTDSLNIIASCYGMNFINEGDEIVLTVSEHHANIIPWQQVCKAKKAVLKYIYLDEDYKLNEEEIETVITDKTKLVCIAHISYALGIINPIHKVIEKAKSVNSLVVIDAAQSIAHLPIDVQKLDIDFLVFSGHKIYAPMGVGILYGKKHLLDEMPPHVFGGGMISSVDEQNTTFAPLPEKFEGGTKNVSAIVGLKVAIDFITSIGWDNIIAEDKTMYKYAYEQLSKLEFIELFVSSDLSNHSGALSFNVNNVHSHDVTSLLDGRGVCIRAGHHCANPLMKFLKINSTCRISFGLYNDKNDIDKLVNSLIYIKELFD